MLNRETLSQKKTNTNKIIIIIKRRAYQETKHFQSLEYRAQERVSSVVQCLSNAGKGQEVHLRDGYEERVSHEKKWPWFIHKSKIKSFDSFYSSKTLTCLCIAFRNDSSSLFRMSLHFQLR